MQGDYEAALSLALKKLRTSDRFESEVRSLLSGYPAETADRVIKFLRGHRMLNDERAASSHAIKRSGHGAERIRQELERRGAPEAAIADVLPSEDQQREDVDRLLKKKYAKEGDAAKAARFLMSRGFDEDLVRSAVISYFGVEA